jgi:hypothetical protein
VPFSDSGDGSGQINVDFVLGLIAYSSGASNFTVAARPRSSSLMHNGGTDADIAVGTTFTTQPAAQAAVEALVAEMGYPWVAIGTVPAPVSNGQVLVAINLANVAQMEDDTGNGISFNQGAVVSGGYAPWADGPTALAALQALTGSVEFP